jgi:hypothetical protein
MALCSGSRVANAAIFLIAVYLCAPDYRRGERFELDLRACKQFDRYPVYLCPNGLLDYMLDTSTGRYRAQYPSPLSMDLAESVEIGSCAAR